MLAAAAAAEGEAVVYEHLERYLERNGEEATFEGWIAQLHPENVRVDDRLLLPASRHATLWKEQRRRTAAARGKESRAEFIACTGLKGRGRLWPCGPRALAEEPGHCPTLEYYTELHLMTNDATQAAATATELCSRCGASSGYATLARLAFASASGFTTGDFDAACAEATPASSPPPPEDSAASSLRGPGLSSRLGAVLMMVSVGVMCVKMW